MKDHPVIAAIEITGYPPNHSLENSDTPEARREFAEDSGKWFFNWLCAGDGDVFDRFAIEYRQQYINWLN